MKTQKIFALILVCLSITSYSYDNLNYGFKRYNYNTFCFDDSYSSGNKFELTLEDGRKAKIVIKNRNNEIIRTGSGTWSGQNDGFGGNAPVIDLILSTGRLKFTAVVDGSSINMLIDSRNNQWLKCSESESVKTNSFSQSTSPNPSSSKESNFDFLPKYVVGTFYSKELGTTLAIEKIPYKARSNYYRTAIDLHGESIKKNVNKWDLRLKVKTKTGKTFNMNLESYNREMLDFNIGDLYYSVVFGKNESGYTLISFLNVVPVQILSTKSGSKPKEYIFKRIK
jgi:hypothetical protein